MVYFGIGAGHGIYLAMEDIGKSLAALQFYVQAGVDEIIGHEPVCQLNKSQVATQPKAANFKIQPVPLATLDESRFQITTDAAKSAIDLASDARDLPSLCETMKNFDACSLKQTATNTVFGVGNPQALVMLVGEAPGAEEDRQGLPFVGISGQLLDRMLASIKLDRKSVYITNMLAWRPPGNRKPTPEEVSMCLPFIQRQIELVMPKILVFVGGTSATNLLNNSAGITRMRGRWFDYRNRDSESKVDIPAMPIFHPAYLLRQPSLKRMAWIDLQTINVRLQELI